MDIERLDAELNELVLAGDALEAFDRFYDDDVVMQEDAEEPVRGKAENRRREEEFFSSVTELREMSLKDVAVGDGVTTSVWHFDYTHAEWGDVSYDQVAVRHWNDDGKVVRERFFKAM